MNPPGAPLVSVVLGFPFVWCVPKNRRSVNAAPFLSLIPVDPNPIPTGAANIHVGARHEFVAV